MRFWIFIYSVLQVDLGAVDSGSVNICLNTMQAKSISCSGYGEMIKIDNIFAAYIGSTVTCDETSQDGEFFKNLPAECSTWQKEAYFRCEGKKSCTVYSWWANTSVPTCLGSQRTNFLQIQYSCRIHSTSVWLSMYRNFTGPVMDIFSPGFPTGTPRGPYTFSCSITAVNNTDVPFEVIIRSNIKLKPIPSENQCLEHLRFKYGPWTTWCSGSEGYYEFNNERRYDSLTMFRFEYKKERNPLGGYFLLEIRGFKNNMAIDLKLDCPDLTSILPSPIPSSSSTVSTTTTVTTTTKTTKTTTSAARTTTGTGTTTTTSTAISTRDASVGTLPETTVESIRMSTSESMTRMVEDGGNDKDYLNDTMLYGTIGAAAALLVIGSLVAIMTCRKWSLFKYCSKESVKSTSETHKEPDTFYSEVEGSEVSPVFENVESKKGAKDNIYQEEADTMYSTVREDEPKMLSNAITIPDDFRPDVYDTVDETSLDNTKNGPDRALYATVDDRDKKLSGQDNETGEVFAAAKFNKMTEHSEKSTSDDNTQTGEVYAAVDKSKKIEKTSVDATENEETLMCDNDELYEVREKIAEEIENREENTTSKDTNYEYVVKKN